MKKTITARIAQGFGIIALVAIIGFSMAGCKETEWEDITQFPSYLQGNWTSDDADAHNLYIGTTTVIWKSDFLGDNNAGTQNWTGTLKSGREDKNTNSAETKLTISKASGGNPFGYSVGQEVDFNVTRLLVLVLTYNGKNWRKIS
jgi:hypothetical protein